MGLRAMRGYQRASEVPGECEGTQDLDSCYGGKVPDQESGNYLQVQVLAYYHNCVSLASSLIALNLSFPPWSMGVVQVEEGCGEMAPHTLLVGAETETLV